MVKLSIVVVAFSNMDCLATCLASIPCEDWIEVIVVNNTHQNRGFGVGCNLGASLSHGEYVFFLNPDCVVDANALKQMVSLLQQDESIGILGPALAKSTGGVYSSCNNVPTRLNSLIVYSGLNQFLRHLPVVNNFWYGFAAPSTQVDVGSVSGAAMLMRRSVFDQVGGFDAKIFLYWEELDLALRVRTLGKRIVFSPQVQIVHEGELSTLQTRPQILKWFRESRFYVFTKHFGWLYGLIAEAWFTFWEEWRLFLLLGGILIAGIFSFYSGAWLIFGSVWDKIIQPFSVVGLQLRYWLGLAGASAAVMVVYNETTGWKTGLRWLTLLLLGLFSLFGLSTYWWLLLTLAALWIIADVVVPIRMLRSVFAILISLIIVVWTGYLGCHLRDMSSIRVSYQRWSEMSQIIAARKSGSVRIRCVGCVHATDLEPLRVLLAQRQVVMDNAGSTVYVVVPPISVKRASIPNSVSMVVGPFKVAWPLN